MSDKQTTSAGEDMVHDKCTFCGEELVGEEANVHDCRDHPSPQEATMESQITPSKLIKRAQWIKTGTRFMTSKDDKRIAIQQFHILMDQIDTLSKQNERLRECIKRRAGFCSDDCKCCATADADSKKTLSNEWRCGKCDGMDIPKHHRNCSQYPLPPSA